VSNPRIQTAASHLLVVGRRCSSSGTCQSAAGGPDRSGRGCWLRAGGMGVLAPRRWAGPRRKGTSSGQGPVAQARHAGVGYSHRDASLDGPPAMAGRPVRPCFPCPDGSGDAVEPAPPARLAVLGIAGEAPLTMSCGRPGPCSGPGQGPPLAQPWSKPDGEPGCGGGGRTAPATAGPRRPPLRRWKLDKRCAHRADGVPSITGSRFRTSEMLGAGERIRTADRPLTRRIAESSEVHRLPDQPRCLISRFWPPWSTPPVHSRC
jgi:hypothetical protein